MLHQCLSAYAHYRLKCLEDPSTVNVSTSRRHHIDGTLLGPYDRYRRSEAATMMPS
jgi:hypothetical protein